MRLCQMAVTTLVLPTGQAIPGDGYTVIWLSGVTKMGFNTSAAPPCRVSAKLLLPDATAAALDLLSRRWVPQVLYLLCQREARFSDLAQAIPGVSRRILTERLRDLADQGLIRREVDGGPPTRITYALTEDGAALRAALEQIDTWATTRHVSRAARP
ncbi:hypothetical protein GCM10023194_57130 [Planotetraspora phitsanulokensis]|uniref:HTH hxlR-type domain-containing protein n=2 Tax=Planotetraspora phitsanulokensis TaxID=575192 RepID=A0A8J3XJD2_9ACTN|nr:hypothetical protein Pph01_80730 [Planotetraspora phitsanulokensis]